MGGTPNRTSVRIRRERYQECTCVCLEEGTNESMTTRWPFASQSESAQSETIPACTLILNFQTMRK